MRIFKSRFAFPQTSSYESLTIRKENKTEKALLISVLQQVTIAWKYGGVSKQFCFYKG